MTISYTTCAEHNASGKFYRTVRRMDKEKLKERLKKVPDQYPDFVTGIISFIKQYPMTENDILKYLEDNPYATTDDIIEFTDSLFEVND